MLDSEKLDMHLDPAAKQANLLNIAIPVNVRGTLANPNVLPDPTALAKNATGALTGLVTGNSAAPPSRPALPAAAEARQREPRQRRSSSRPSSTSPTDQLLPQGTKKGTEEVGKALKGLLD